MFNITKEGNVMVNVNELSMHEKLGQMMRVGFDGNKISDRIKDLVLKYKVGGFIILTLMSKCCKL